MLLLMRGGRLLLVSLRGGYRFLGRHTNGTGGPCFVARVRTDDELIGKNNGGPSGDFCARPVGGRCQDKCAIKRPDAMRRICTPSSINNMAYILIWLDETTHLPQTAHAP